jgi:cytoskeletal protein RodZ
MTQPLPAPASQNPPPTTSLLDQLRVRSSRELTFRIVILVIIFGSLGLAWWSFAKVLPPLQNKSKELTSTLSRLNTDVDELERKWPKEAELEVTNKYNEVRSQLFSNEAAFDSWLANLNGQASTLTLDAKADFGKTSPVTAPGEKLATIPASIFVEVRPSQTGSLAQSPYQRIIQLTEQLCLQQKRTDLAQLTLAGGVGSISRALVVLHLWAGEDKTP